MWAKIFALYTKIQMRLSVFTFHMWPTSYNTDEDECEFEDPICGKNAKCYNTEGSYYWATRRLHRLLSSLRTKVDPPLINSALRTNLNLCSWPFSLTLTGVRRTKPSAALILCVITYLAPFSIRVFWVSWPGMDRNGLMQSRIRRNCEADKYSCKNVLTFSDICVSEMFYPILHFGEILTLKNNNPIISDSWLWH